MYNKTQLNELYEDYREGRVGKKLLEGKVIGEILSRSRHIQGGLRDYAAYLYPRICGALERYRDTGSSFEHYITSVAGKVLREFQIKEAQRGVIERTFWSAKAREYSSEKVADVENPYGERASGDLPFEKARPPKRFRNARQILALLLKSYYFMSDDMMERLAPSLGISKTRLEMLIMELRELRAAREQEIHTLRERVHTQYYRCLAHQYRLTQAEGSLKKEQCEKRLKGAYERLLQMRKNLARLNVEPSNREIAQVLGVSKGAVDSSLFNVKRRYAHILEEQ